MFDLTEQRDQLGGFIQSHQPKLSLQDCLGLADAILAMNFRRYPDHVIEAVASGRVPPTDRGGKIGVRTERQFIAYDADEVVSPAGAILLLKGGKTVAGFAPGQWWSFTEMPTP